MDKEIKGRLPPFTEALINHTKEKQFPFDTPGHHGGDFYNLTEEGKAFTRFYGNAMFAADMSDSGNDPGNPSSHEGAAGAAEKLAADTFGADRAWFVLHGTSVSNRICCQALLSEMISSFLTGTAINPFIKAPFSNAAPFRSAWTPCG